ncbi:MAG: FAD-binding protein [Pirellulaceae bacterium]
MPRAELDRKLGGILEIYEKFQGVDPRDSPMKIFPAVHYSMGGLWVDYVKNAEQGFEGGDPGNQRTNIPNLYAIGECDYQYHGANRLGANSLLSCIFSGLFLAPCLQTLLNSVLRCRGGARREPLSSAVKDHEGAASALLSRIGGENPYLVHQELGM